MPPTCRPHPAPTPSPPRACGGRLGLRAADHGVQDPPRGAELPLLQEAAQPVCRKPFWAHEDSSTRAAAPGVLQRLGPRSWPWGKGGVHSGRNRCPDPAPHHGRCFCTEHGPLAQPSTTIPCGSTRPCSHGGHAGPVPEGGVTPATPLPTSARQPAQPLWTNTLSEGARRPGPQQHWPSAGLPPPDVHPLTAALLAGCRPTPRAPGPPCGLSAGPPALAIGTLLCVFLGQDDPFSAFIMFSK